MWVYFRALRLGRARFALDTAHGIALAFGTETEGQAARDAAFDEAFPLEGPDGPDEPEALTDGE